MTGQYARCALKKETYGDIDNLRNTTKEYHVHKISMLGRFSSTFLMVPYTARASFKNRSQGLGLLESRENHLVGRFFIMTVSARSPGMHSDQFFLPESNGAY